MPHGLEDEEWDSLTPQQRAAVEREDEAYDAQEAWIKENCGDEAANTANYGWFVDEVDGNICTKVYGHGVLTTVIATLEHEWDPY